MGAGEYRALLESMMREQGDRSGYSFVKENADTEQPEVCVRWLLCVCVWCLCMHC